MGSKILELDPNIVPRILDPCWKAVAEAVRGAWADTFLASENASYEKTGVEEGRLLT